MEDQTRYCRSYEIYRDFSHALKGITWSSEDTAPDLLLTNHAGEVEVGPATVVVTSMNVTLFLATALYKYVGSSAWRNCLGRRRCSSSTARVQDRSWQCCSPDGVTGVCNAGRPVKGHHQGWFTAMSQQYRSSLLGLRSTC